MYWVSESGLQCNYVGLNFRISCEKRETGRQDTLIPWGPRWFFSLNTNWVPKSKHKTSRRGNVYLGVDVLGVCEVFLCVLGMYE